MLVNRPWIEIPKRTIWNRWREALLWARPPRRYIEVKFPQEPPEWKERYACTPPTQHHHHATISASPPAHLANRLKLKQSDQVVSCSICIIQTAVIRTVDILCCNISRQLLNEQCEIATGKEGKTNPHMTANCLLAVNSHRATVLICPHPCYFKRNQQANSLIQPPAKQSQQCQKCKRCPKANGGKKRPRTEFDLFM